MNLSHKQMMSFIWHWVIFVSLCLKNQQDVKFKMWCTSFQLPVACFVLYIIKKRRDAEKEEQIKDQRSRNSSSHLPSNLFHSSLTLRPETAERFRFHIWIKNWSSSICSVHSLKRLTEKVRGIIKLYCLNQSRPAKLRFKVTKLWQKVT